MTAAFPAHNTSCLCCAATGAKPGKDFGLCSWCWKRFCRYTQVRTPELIKKLTANQCNEWLARELFMQCRRLKEFGVIGRCEAASGGDSVLIDKGYLEHGKYQCERFATHMRDGRRVCSAHSKGRCRRVMWAASPRERPYEQLTNMMVEIAGRDERFRRCVDEAHAALSAPDHRKEPENG